MSLDAVVCRLFHHDSFSMCECCWSKFFFEMQLWYGAPTVKSNHYNVDKKKKALRLALASSLEFERTKKKTRQLLSYARFEQRAKARARNFDFSFILLHVYLLLERRCVEAILMVRWSSNLRVSCKLASWKAASFICFWTFALMKTWVFIWVKTEALV